MKNDFKIVFFIERVEECIIFIELLNLFIDIYFICKFVNI